MDSLVEKIRAFNRFISIYNGSLSRHYMDSPYNTSEVRILYEIYEHKQVSARDLTLVLHMDKSYISRILSRLEKDQLLTKAVSKEDKRFFEIHLTTKGRSLTKQLIGRTNRDIQERVAALSKEEQKELYLALTKVENLLQKGEDG